MSAGRILVVDDEPRIGAMVCEFLNDAGFDSDWAPNDRVAYDRLRRSQPFHAVVVDVNLGRGTTGFDVARLARQLNAATGVVYVSGEFSERSWAAHGVPGSRFVSKPFDLEALAAALDELIVDLVPASPPGDWR